MPLEVIEVNGEGSRLGSDPRYAADVKQDMAEAAQRINEERGQIIGSFLFEGQARWERLGGGYYGYKNNLFLLVDFPPYSDPAHIAAITTSAEQAIEASSPLEDAYGDVPRNIIQKIISAVSS